MSKNILVKPVLKWVGGKRQLLDDIRAYVPSKCSTYVEPFVGGGAVLFDLQPKKAIINDYNYELINVYNTIRDNPDTLISTLKIHELRNNSAYYYNIRALDREPSYNQLSSVEKAARIIYLNKTCYNGLYRVNTAGQFNTPYGKYKSPLIVDEITIKAMSHYLNSANIRMMSGDYKLALKGLRKGSFVYLDPPYMPISSSASFTGYTEGGFDYSKQTELRDQCILLDRKGISFLQSNSDCKEIRELYGNIEGISIVTVKAKRNINRDGNKRGEINEVLIYNGER